MPKHILNKLANKLLCQDKKGQELKKYNIELGVDNQELQHNEHRRLIGLTKTCLSSQLHFWIAKKNGDYTARINAIERDIKTAVNISERINKKTSTPEDIINLRDILNKYGCV